MVVLGGGAVSYERGTPVECLRPSCSTNGMKGYLDLETDTQRTFGFPFLKIQEKRGNRSVSISQDLRKIAGRRFRQVPQFSHKVGGEEDAGNATVLEKVNSLKIATGCGFHF